MTEHALASDGTAGQTSRVVSLTGHTRPGSGNQRRTGVLSPFQPFKELLLVGGTAFVQIGATAMAARNQPEYGSLGFGAALLLALAALMLPLRHRLPVLTLLLIFTTTLAYWTLDNPGGPVFLALIIALIHVVLIGRRWVAIPLLVAGFVLFPWLGYLLGEEDRPALGHLVALMAWLVALMAVTEVVRIRRDRLAEAARSAAEAMRRQAADERVRIARDLHDSVAHNMSLISIHAGVALHLLEESQRGQTDRKAEEVGRTPEAGSHENRGKSAAQVSQSLAIIKEASREALVELRSVLGVLRHVDEPAEPQQDRPREGTDDVPYAPVPGLQRLDTLIARAQSVGLDVRLELPIGEDSLRALPRPVDLAAFRIIQESLTNVSRHSDSPTALVRIAERDGMLTVDVLDEGSGQPAVSPDVPGGGNGIIGMRERAAAVGGRLRVGPRPAQGFAVRAELPLDPFANNGLEGQEPEGAA